MFAIGYTAFMNKSDKPSVMLYIAIALAIIIGIPYMFFYSWASAAFSTSYNLMFYEFFRSLVFFIPVLLIILVAVAAYKFTQPKK